MRTLLSGVATLGESILVALAVPIVVLAAGTPVVLIVRLALDVARSF
jgi:hypothetical protein